MAKVFVKLNNAAARFKDDSGKQLEPHVVHELELSERVQKAIEIGLLEKQPEPQKKDKRAPAVEPEPTEEKESAKKNL